MSGIETLKRVARIVKGDEALSLSAGQIEILLADITTLESRAQAAEARADEAELKAKRNYGEAFDKHYGTPCEQIRHAQEKEELESRVQAAESYAWDITDTLDKTTARMEAAEQNCIEQKAYLDQIAATVLNIPVEERFTYSPADLWKVAKRLAAQPAFDHRALAVEIVQAMDSKDWIFNKQRQCIDGVEQILRKASGVGYVSDLEKQMLNIIDERDFAEAALGRAYRLVMGREPKWSECFGYDDALREIDTAVNTPEPPAPDTERKLAEAEADREAQIEATRNADERLSDAWERAETAERKLARAVEALRRAGGMFNELLAELPEDSTHIVPTTMLMLDIDAAVADLGTAPAEREGEK